MIPPGQREVPELRYGPWRADQQADHANERLRALRCPGCGAVLACQFTYDMGAPTSMVRTFAGCLTRLRDELVLRADLSPSPHGRRVYGPPRRQQLGKTGHPILRRDPYRRGARARPISYDMHPEFPGVWFSQDARPPCEILCLCERRLQLTHEQGTILADRVGRGRILAG